MGGVLSPRRRRAGCRRRIPTPTSRRSCPARRRRCVISQLGINSRSQSMSTTTRCRRPHRVNIHTTITADDGNVVFTSNDERKSDELKGVNGTYGHVATIPLKGVAPGRYVLRVEAKSTLRTTPPRRARSSSPYGDGRHRNHRARGRQQAGRAAPLRHPRPPGVCRHLGGARRSERHRAAVDFETRMVAAVFSGTRPTPRYRIEITGTQREGSALVVVIAERSRTRSQVVAQVVVSPFHVVTLPRDDGEVRFDVPDPHGQHTDCFQEPAAASSVVRGDQSSGNRPAHTSRLSGVTNPPSSLLGHAGVSLPASRTCGSVLGGAAAGERAGERVRAVPCLAGAGRPRCPRDCGRLVPRAGFRPADCVADGILGDVLACSRDGRRVARRVGVVRADCLSRPCRQTPVCGSLCREARHPPSYQPSRFRSSVTCPA